jgi:hypothetical protein
MDDDKYIEYPLDYEKIVARQLEMLEMDYSETLKCNFGERNEDECEDVQGYECLDESVDDGNDDGECENIVEEKKKKDDDELNDEDCVDVKIEDIIHLKDQIKHYTIPNINADSIKEKMKKIKPIKNETEITDEELIKNLINFTS